jgi:hypothetical protein
VFEAITTRFKRSTLEHFSSPEDVLLSVDASYDYLSPYYENFGVRSIVAASEPAAATSMADFDPNLAALIALLIILFLGIIMFSIVCCCLRNWVFAKAAARSDCTVSSDHVSILSRIVIFTYVRT